MRWAGHVARICDDGKCPSEDKLVVDNTNVVIQQS